MDDVSQQPHLIAELGKSPEALAQLAYVTGNYTEAINRLETAVQSSRLRRRRHAMRLLSLAYFQTGRFADGADLPLRDPLTRLMRGFPGTPNNLDPVQHRPVELPFLQSEAWQLPRLAVTVNGVTIQAKLDTGGDLFSVPWQDAGQLGIEPLVTTTGRFAGGRRSRIGLARLDDLRLGDLAITDVPVSVNSFDQAVIGIGLLRQFRPTIDYPDGKLILARRGGAEEPNGGFPFWLVHTHLLVAAGSLNGVPLNFLVDSGLEVENGACFAAPESTLEKLSISNPTRVRTEGHSGAGTTHLRLGEFPIASISLGPALRRHEAGLTGVFPQQLTRTLPPGIRLHGLISHHFLRHYRWTIDFDRMRMELAS